VTSQYHNCYNQKYHCAIDNEKYIPFKQCNTASKSVQSM